METINRASESSPLKKPKGKIVNVKNDDVKAKCVSKKKNKSSDVLKKSKSCDDSKKTKPSKKSKSNAAPNKLIRKSKPKSEPGNKREKLEEYTPGLPDELADVELITPLNELAFEVAPPELLKPPHLLLAYTYFLNGDFTKFVSVGYSSTRLKPVVLLHSTGNQPVILNPIEWYLIFGYQPDIEKTFFGNGFKTPKILADDVQIAATDTQEIILSKGINKMAINYLDWLVLVQLTELFKSILHLYNKTQDCVQQYFLRYTHLCFEKNALSLDTSQFFTLDSQFNCNFPRLFNELGLLFKQKTIIFPK